MSIKTDKKTSLKKENLLYQIKSKKANIAIIGLGYVGLPLAVEFARIGFTVTGIDIKDWKIKIIQSGKSYIQDVRDKDIRLLIASGKLAGTTDYSVLARMDVIVICVSTPLAKTKDPDVSQIIESVTQIARYIRPKQLIILESTTYPGTTDELVLPILEKDGHKAGRDFYLAYSPERIDPGNKKYPIIKIPKIVGGIDAESSLHAKQFYKMIIEKVIPVSSARVAEMTKLVENTFRSVNIALANELAQLANKLNIDIWEVIAAAATKPYGYMPFYPGPGLGGHCIPVDPIYLSWRAKMEGFESRFIDLARQINSAMPKHVVWEISAALNNNSKPVRNANILLLGVAYKNDINDIRESPAFDIIKLLEDKGAQVGYSDPYVPILKTDGKEYISVDINIANLKKFDCGVILTAHKKFRYALLVKHLPLLVDTRNALKNFNDKHIIRL